MKKFWQYLYYFIITPVFLIGIHAVALFSSKIRAGLIPRYTTMSRLKKWISENSPSGPRILFHTASLGEYEHIRPLLQTMKEDYKTVNIITFFSPSGYQNVGEDSSLDFYFYFPFDLKKNWREIYKAIKPTLIIIAKWDVWPGQVWTAEEMNIPIYLINASLRGDSRRTKRGIKRFLKHVFRDFSSIFAVSDVDRDRYVEYYPRCPVKVVGDTKYDQVVLRKKHALSQSLIPEKWTKDHWIFVAGSIWPEDEEHLFPALEKVIEEISNIRLILVPHQPEQKAIEKIGNTFDLWGVQKFTNRNNLTNERIMIIDAIGYLASLYHYAQCAYVGGSFKQGVHNVMEPAIFGIPVLYGPIHKNSHEAVEFSKGNGGFVVKNSDSILKHIYKFHKNNDERLLFGQKAEKFALRNTGATEKLLTFWQNYLN
jgi:3-deoxy-D-manno-octulosonic-acid transferase